jgi:hypothetical protein
VGLETRQASVLDLSFFFFTSFASFYIVAHNNNRTVVRSRLRSLSCSPCVTARRALFLTPSLSSFPFPTFFPLLTDRSRAVLSTCLFSYAPPISGPPTAPVKQTSSYIRPFFLLRRPNNSRQLHIKAFRHNPPNPPRTFFRRSSIPFSPAFRNLTGQTQQRIGRLPEGLRTIKLDFQTGATTENLTIPP